MTGALPTIGVDLRALVGRPSGIGFFTLALLRALAVRGGARYRGLSHRPVFGAADLEALGIELETRSAPLGVLWQQIHLPLRLRRGDIDLLWSPILTLPAVSPVPSVVTVHDLTPLLYSETHSLKVRASILPFIRRTVETARTVVADSRATAEDLRRQFPQVSDKIEVVYPGVDPEFAPGEPDTIEKTRQDLEAPRGYILFVGTLEPRKNVPLLLDAWETLRRNDPATLPLVLVGPYGWRSRSLMTRIRNLAPLGLVYLDHLDRRRLVEIFQAARLFVLPSVYEGFGLPAAEALACGIPTVVSDTSSLPEVVGDAGLLIDHDDPEDLAAAIANVLGDADRERDLAERGPRQAARFTWEKAAESMAAIFDHSLLPHA